MAIFEIDGEQPQFPADGLYWIAETAVVIGSAEAPLGELRVRAPAAQAGTLAGWAALETSDAVGCQAAVACAGVIAGKAVASS